MDCDVDAEPPSPKRRRLENPDPDVPHATLAMDKKHDTDDSVGASALQSEPLDQNDALRMESAITPRDPKSMRLPGLSLPGDEPMLEPDIVLQSVHSTRDADDSGLPLAGVGEMNAAVGNRANGAPALQEQQISSEKEGSSLDTDLLSLRCPRSEGDLKVDGLTTQMVAVVEKNTSPTTDEVVHNLHEATSKLPSTSSRPEHIHDESPSDVRQPADGGKTAHEVTKLINGIAEDASNGDDLVTEAKIPSSVTSKNNPIDVSIEEPAKADRLNTEAEFEVDSSPYESSSTDDSTDTSSSDDSEVEDYEMLSPEEEARRLMAEDGGGEDKATSGVPRTLNEKPEEVIPKPNVTITADMKLEELGRVENLVENLALVKANTSGEYQVLESGSVLCLEDRSVIGVIAETLGRVQQPYYSIRFTNQAAMTEAGIAKDTTVFYVAHYATTVFTQPLKAFKGSDASNLHDEEVGDDELEFSDDEAEAEHKRQVKIQKKARYNAKHGHDEGFLRAPSKRPGKPDYEHSLASQEQLPSHNEPSLNYDDANEESDDLYTPLSRPSNLHEMMASKEGSIDSPTKRGSSQRGGRGRRGLPGEGRGRHHGRGRGGSFNQRGHQSSRGNGHTHAHQSTGPAISPAQRSGAPDPSSNYIPPQIPPQPNGVHSHPQSQHSLFQQPQYPPQSLHQTHSHPSYPSQYPTFADQSYQQPYQQSQYAQDPYLQGISHQIYNQQQGLDSRSYYSSQQPPPMPPSPAAIPPGAHINPKFFRQQGHNPPHPFQQQQTPQPPHQYQQYQQRSFPSNSTG